MNKKKLFIMISLTLVLAITICLVAQETISADKCRIVRIHGYAYPGKNVRIEPDTIWAAQGTCVVWVNLARNQIRIVFEDGKKCADVTDAPTGFSLDAKSCYVTTFLPLGGTSSLRFSEKGTFDYVVEAFGGEVKEKGKIIVE